MSATDTIDGGAGTDTLNYTDASTTGVIPATLVKNVEVINIRNVNTAGGVGNKETFAVTVAGTEVGSDTTVAFDNTSITLAANTGGTAIAADYAAKYNALSGTNFVASAAAGVITFTQKVAAAMTDKVTSDFVITDPGAGDTTAVTFTVAAPTVQGTTVTGVGDTIAANNFVGATNFNSNLSSNALTINSLAQGQQVGIIGNGTAANGALTANYATSATAAVLNVSGGTGPTNTTAPAVSITGGATLTSATINSTGTVANTLGGVALGGNATALTVNADARLTTGTISGFTGTTATITVKGAAAGTATAAAVNLGTIDGAVKSIDASGLTAGGVAAVLNSNQAFTFTGGQGQDIVQTGAVLTTGLVDAGAGTTDRLVVTAAVTDHIDATTGKLYKNFEQVQVEDGESVNLSHLASTNTIDTIRINDGSAAAGTGVTNLSATQAANVTILAANATGAITIGVKDATTAGQIDTVKASLVNTNAAGTAGVAVDLSGLTLAGVEKLELTGTGTSTATSGAVTLTTANALSLDSIKLTSAANNNLVTVDVGHLASNLTIDASASTGSVTLNAAAYTAGTTGAALTGGSSFDVLLGASGKADKIVGGAGNDVIVGSALTGGTLTAGTATAIGTFTGGTIAGSTAADILSGGAGKDAFVLGINSGAATISSITDLDLGGATAALGQDQITLKLAATTAATIYTLTDAQKTAISGAADLATALDLVAAATNAATNNGTAQFTYGTDTYLFVNSSSTTATYVAGTDAVIKITGVTGTLDASDIVFI